MWFSLYKKDPARQTRERALEQAIENLPMDFFDSTEGQMLRAYSLLALHTSSLPGWHPAHLFVLGKKMLMYPIAFRMVARPHAFAEELHFNDYAPTPYVWITRKKHLILSVDGRLFQVSPPVIHDLLHETLIDRLILSLNRDRQALVVVYADEVLVNIGIRPIE